MKLFRLDFGIKDRYRRGLAQGTRTSRTPPSESALLHRHTAGEHDPHHLSNSPSSASVLFSAGTRAFKPRGDPPEQWNQIGSSSIEASVPFTFSSASAKVNNGIKLPRHSNSHDNHYYSSNNSSSSIGGSNNNNGFIEADSSVHPLLVATALPHAARGRGGRHLGQEYDNGEEYEQDTMNDGYLSSSSSSSSSSTSSSRHSFQSLLTSNSAIAPSSSYSSDDDENDERGAGGDDGDDDMDEDDYDYEDDDDGGSSGFSGGAGDDSADEDGYEGENSSPTVRRRGGGGQSQQLYHHRQHLQRQQQRYKQQLRTHFNHYGYGGRRGSGVVEGAGGHGGLLTPGPVPAIVPLLNREALEQEARQRRWERHMDKRRQSLNGTAPAPTPRRKKKKKAKDLRKQVLVKNAQQQVD